MLNNATQARANAFLVQYSIPITHKCYNIRVNGLQVCEEQ